MISVFAIVGNSLIIVLVIKDPLNKLRSPFNYFLVNLAVSDLIIGVVTMPISFYVHYEDITSVIVRGPFYVLLHLSAR